MNNYCKKCRLRDGCIQKCKEAEIYEQGYNDAVKELKKLKKTTMGSKYKLWVARDKDGLLVLFRGKPVRDNDYKEWCTNDYCEDKHLYNSCLPINTSLFKNLTWEDEPIEVELRPAITDLEAKAHEYANSVTDNKEIRELIINAFKAGYNI